MGLLKPCMGGTVVAQIWRSSNWQTRTRTCYFMVFHFHCNVWRYVFLLCSQIYQSFSEFLANQKRERGELVTRRGTLPPASAYEARVKLYPTWCDVRAAPTYPANDLSRLYMDAVSMAKPRRRDVMAKENNSTSYEPSKVRCAFVFFFFSPSRGQIFGLSAQWKRYAHTMSTAHGVARLFARRRGAGERLNARQVEQKKPVLRSTCKYPRNQNELYMVNSLCRIMWA